MDILSKIYERADILVICEKCLKLKLPNTKNVSRNKPNKPKKLTNYVSRRVCRNGHIKINYKHTNVSIIRAYICSKFVENTVRKRDYLTRISHKFFTVSTLKMR